MSTTCWNISKKGQEKERCQSAVTPVSATFRRRTLHWEEYPFVMPDPNFSNFSLSSHDEAQKESCFIQSFLS
jgi:hypothetical protein